jgi:hypothetical protein
MPRKKQADAARIGLLEAKVSTAPCVPGIREKVKAWRKHQLMKRGVRREGDHLSTGVRQSSNHQNVEM